MKDYFIIPIFFMRLRNACKRVLDRVGVILSEKEHFHYRVKIKNSGVNMFSS